MKILWTMTLNQFRILIRNRGLLVGSLGLAVVSMLIFGALFGNNNAQPIRVGVADLDKSAASAQVIAALKQNSALEVSEGSSPDELVQGMKNGQRSAVLILQPGFGAGLGQKNAQVQLYVDQTDLIGAARSRGTITGVLDGISKQSAGFQDPIKVQEQQVSVKQQRQIDFLTPGMLGVTVMFANLSVGIALIGWRERGTLKRLSATPLKAWQLIVAQILGQFALSFVQVAVILGLAVAVFNVQITLETLPAILIFCAAGVFSIISLGYAVANFVKKPEAAQSVSTLIALPMMFLSGSYFQVDPPAFLKPLVEVLPLTHMIRALRQIMLNGASLGSQLLPLGILLAYGTVLLALSVKTFQWSK